MGARVYVAGARVHVRSYWWEPESMLQEPESMLGVVGGARVYAAGARVYASLVIIVSAQALWVLALGTLDLGMIIGDKFTKRLSIFPTIINVRLSDQREILISMKVNEIIGRF